MHKNEVRLTHNSIYSMSSQCIIVRCYSGFINLNVKCEPLSSVQILVPQHHLLARVTEHCPNTFPKSRSSEPSVGFEVTQASSTNIKCEPLSSVQILVPQHHLLARVTEHCPNTFPKSRSFEPSVGFEVTQASSTNIKCEILSSVQILVPQHHLLARVTEHCPNTFPKSRSFEPSVGFEVTQASSTNIKCEPLSSVQILVPQHHLLARVTEHCPNTFPKSRSFEPSVGFEVTQASSTNIKCETTLFCTNPCATASFACTSHRALSKHFPKVSLL